jgi:hypothetical protein
LISASFTGGGAGGGVAAFFSRSWLQAIVRDKAATNENDSARALMLLSFFCSTVVGHAKIEERNRAFSATQTIRCYWNVSVRKGCPALRRLRRGAPGTQFSVITLQTK